MSFMLEVEISGLCLYVVHPDGQKVTVLMPDCRDTTADPRHVDTRKGTPHVGYLRYDLADQVSGVPKADSDTPLYEVVRQFDLESLDLGFAGGVAIEGLVPGASPTAPDELLVPGVNGFADKLEVPQAMFGDAPPAVLLMRAVLTGGRFDSTNDGKGWHLDATLNSVPTNYEGQFAQFTTWSRRVDAEALEISIKQFGSAGVQTIRLAPPGNAPDRVLRVKLANLCAVNPLEWRALGLPEVRLRKDEDFKWLYRVLAPRNESYESALNHRELPVPTLLADVPEGSLDLCYSARITQAH